MHRKHIFRTGLRFISLVVMAANSSAALAGPLDNESGRFARAMMDLDYSMIASLSHPAVVKAAKGKKAYEKLLQQTYASSGVRFKKMSFGRATDKRRYGKVVIATVPYTMVVSAGKENINVSSFYYAFSGRNEKAWFFMDCTGASDKFLASLVEGYDGKLKKPRPCE